MIASMEEDRKWSDKKMEANDGLRTLECLRGRLLAERQASRVAKEDAELMGNKLIELENRLREETRLRNKAEKKLKFLMKKLKALKRSPFLEESEQSSSSENCALSCRSFTSTSDPIDQEDQEPKSQITTPVTSQNLDHNVSETTSMQSLESPLSEENSSDKSSPSCEDTKTENHSFSSLNDSRVEMEINARHESDYEDYVDNSLALVPVSWPVTNKPSSELKIANKSVCEVLDALRHARERIQYSMERRHMIRVGPA